DWTLSLMGIPSERAADDRWKDLHAHFVSEARDKEADVLILGDDHVALLEQSNFYRDQLAALHCLVFGMMGDTVSLAEWRVTNGEIERIPAKVVLLSIGHNDVLVSSPDEFLTRLESLVKEVQTRLPLAAIFVMKLIPSGRSAASRPRHWISSVNSSMETRLGSLASVIDIDTSIINSEGLIDRHLLFDYFHLTQEGYSRVFENVHLALSEALNP
ncbi:hypothetical protein PENTCL1PPCAC_28882, partial [Pristionchus entomophagus]